MKNTNIILLLLLPWGLMLTACGGSSDSALQQNTSSSANMTSSVAQSVASQMSSSSSSQNSAQSSVQSSIKSSSSNSVVLPVVSSQASSSKSVSSSVVSSSMSSMSSSISSSKSSQSSSSKISSSSSTSSSQSSSGCGKAFTTGDIKGLIVKDGAGRDRSFDINVSPDYSANSGASLIFNFHGNGGTSEGSAAAGFQFAAAETQDRVISVFPQGIWWENFGVGWEESCNGYDMVFFDNMLKYLNENYCVNSNKVFVTGFSWGGDMTNALACCRGEKIKSIATISGPERINSSCPTTKWPVTWMRYSTNDGAYSQNMFDSTRQFYIQKLGCSTSSTLMTGDAECSIYSGCTTPLTVCSRSVGHAPLSYPEVQQLWQYWRSLP